jgi:hypothetical protein
MDRSKSFMIVFTFIIFSFLIGRTLGNSDYRELKNEYKLLESEYSTTAFNQQGYFKLSPEQVKTLNRGLYYFAQGTYQVGVGEDIYPGSYSFTSSSNVETNVIINNQNYKLCGEVVTETCQESYEGINITDANYIIIEGGSVQFNIEN